MDSFEREALPSDMVYEVLSRTQLQTMDKCKVVSKEWNQLILSSPFMASYGKNTGNLFGYILDNPVKYKHVYKFVSPISDDMNESFKVINSTNFEFDVKIEASSLQGILCCVRRVKGGQYRYYVCKPTTNQWQPLPNPKRPQCCNTREVGLAVLSTNPLRYKIFRISKPRHWRSDCLNYRLEIFDSRNWAWKQGEDILLSEETYLFCRSPAVYASGLICFHTNQYILAFLADQETRLTIPLPEELSCKNNLSGTKKIVEYQGKLGLIFENEGYDEFWMLKDWKIGRWEMIEMLDKEILERAIKFQAAPEGFYNREVMLTSSYFAVQFWNLKDFSFNQIKLLNTFPNRVYPFRSDWEPVSLQPEMKKAPIIPYRKHSIYVFVSIVVFLFLFLLLIVIR